MASDAKPPIEMESKSMFEVFNYMAVMSLVFFFIHTETYLNFHYSNQMFCGYFFHITLKYSEEPSKDKLRCYIFYMLNVLNWMIFCPAMYFGVSEIFFEDIF